MLRRGDRVEVVAPAFAVSSRALGGGLRWLERAGFRVSLGQYVGARAGYFAGDDAQRRADLNRALADPDVRAVWFARGGYGSARLLDGVDWAPLRRQGKLLVGYSDITALFAAVPRWARARCLYGPVVAELGRPASFHLPSLRSALAGRPITERLPRHSVLVPGRTAGPLRGGNLTVLASLLGTPFMPDLRGSVVLLEDVGEPLYRLDRMLWQLRRAGCLRGVRGVLVGSFDPVPRPREGRERSVREVLMEALGGLGIPVVHGLPVGHCPGKWTLPLGGEVVLDTHRGRLVSGLRSERLR